VERIDGDPMVMVVDDVVSLHATRDLRQVAIFSDIDDATLVRVACVAHRQTYQRGRLLVEAAGYAGAIHAIMRGRIHFYRRSPWRKEVTLDVMRAGEIFKLLAPDADGTPGGVAEALDSPTVVYHIPTPPLLEALTPSPHMLLRLLDETERKIARLYDAEAELVLYDAEARLARLLVRLAARDETRRVEETQQELGWLINASREEVNKFLRHFASLGLIDERAHRRGTVVRDAAGLTLLAARHGRTFEP